MPKQETRSVTSRRDVLAGAAMAGLVVPLATKAMAETAHHHHSAGHQELTDLALTCVGRGEECVAHCVQVMGDGDTSLKDCLTSVNEMLPICATLARYAALNAKQLKQLAKVCSDVCDDCAKECEKHAAEHEECKVCGEACNTLTAALKNLIAT